MYISCTERHSWLLSYECYSNHPNMDRTQQEDRPWLVCYYEQVKWIIIYKKRFFVAISIRVKKLCQNLSPHFDFGWRNSSCCYNGYHHSKIATKIGDQTSFDWWTSTHTLLKVMKTFDLNFFLLAFFIWKKPGTHTTITKSLGHYHEFKYVYIFMLFLTQMRSIMLDAVIMSTKPLIATF